MNPADESTDHHLVTIIGTAIDAELLADAAWVAGAVGAEELGGATRVAFLDPDAARRFAEIHGGTVERAAIDTGRDAWRDHATTHTAGPFHIRPPWLPQSADPAAIDLVVDPAHEFGGGSHPSSRLALELLAATITPGATVVDLGAGSGILGIAAARLGATVVAVDIEPTAPTTIATNASTNGVAAAITARCADITAVAGEFDVGLCNVTVDIHEAIGSALRHNTTIGLLIVAGLLVGDQETRVARAHARPVITRRTDGEWAALLLGPVDTGVGPDAP